MQRFIKSKKNSCFSKDVIMIKSNLIDIDTRLMKESETLEKFNHHVSFLCWNRENKSNLSYNNSEIKSLDLKGPYNKNIVILMPIWNLYVLYHLLFSRYDIIHVINFDSYISALIAAKIRKKPIIYEIEDTYEDHTKLPSTIRKFLLNLDKFFLKYADGVILVDECQINEFNGLVHPNMQIIYDSPSDLSNKFQKRVNEKGTFTIFYPGVLEKARKLNIDPIIQFVEKTDNVQLIISGYGDLVEDIKIKSNRNPQKVKYIGWIENRQEMFKLMNEADTTFVLKDRSIPLNKYICGSKVFEAMMCSIPIIVNKNTSAALKVEKHKCGIIVDANNQEDIELAILKLIEKPIFKEQLGTNGRNIYETKYNWKLMEEKIECVYSNVIS